MDECTSCGNPTQWRTEGKGKTSQNDCKFYCPAGSHIASDAHKYFCEGCRKHTYKISGYYYAVSCTNCPSDRPRTDIVNATAESDCKPGDCTAGEILLRDGIHCTVCGHDTYQPEPEPTETTRCLQCGKTSSGISIGTKQEGSTSKTDCLPFCNAGEQLETNGVCEPCPRGFYKSNNQEAARFDPCIPCPVNFITDDVGATDSESCTRVFTDRTRYTFSITLDIKWSDDYANPSSSAYLDLKTRILKSIEYLLNKELADIYRSGLRLRAMIKGSVIVSLEAFFAKTNSSDTDVKHRLQNKLTSVVKRGEIPAPPDHIFAPLKTVRTAPPQVAKIPDKAPSCSAGERLSDDDRCEPCPLGYYQPNDGEYLCYKCPAGYSTYDTGAHSCKEVVVQSDLPLIIGVPVGLFLLIVISVLIVCYMRRKRQRNERGKHEDNETAAEETASPSLQPSQETSFSSEGAYETLGPQHDPTPSVYSRVNPPTTPAPTSAVYSVLHRPTEATTPSVYARIDQPRQETTPTVYSRLGRLAQATPPSVYARIDRPGQATIPSVYSSRNRSAQGSTHTR